MIASNSATSARIGAALAAAAIASLGGQAASAQTYGLATMAPGTLAHTAASAIAKVLKEKGGMNVAGAGDRRQIRADPDGGARARSTSASPTCWRCMEGIETGKLQNDLRIIGSIYTLRIGLFARKDSGMTSMADLKGKRVPAGYSAMRTLDKNTQAMLATAKLTLERRQAGDGAERDPRRRRLHRRRDRRVHVLVRRPEGARGRRLGRRRARARGRRDAGRHRREPQDLPLRLFRRGQARPGVRRRREADEGLRHGLRAVHQRQDARTRWSRRSSTPWSRTRPTWSRSRRS